jgi:hypothetical protein
VWAVEGCNGIGRHIAPTMVSASYCKAQDPLRHKGYTDSGDDSHRDRR